MTTRDEKTPFKTYIFYFMWGGFCKQIRAIGPNVHRRIGPVIIQKWVQRFFTLGLKTLAEVSLNSYAVSKKEKDFARKRHL